MPHISLEDHLPGITGLLEYRKDSGKPIRELTQFLMRSPSTLTEAERELIAIVVSNENECTFCTTAHTAAADLLLGESSTTQKVKLNITTAPVSEKMKALLKIASKVTDNSKSVSKEDIDEARAKGASEIEIHDTVLIAALFCFYNRYVDGLAATVPANTNYYNDLANRLVNHGYTRLPQGYDHLKK